MVTVREAVFGIGCFLGIIFAWELLLTLHDIRNELRANRRARERLEVTLVPYKLS